MRPILALAALVVLAASTDGLAINKCVDKEGRTTYQEVACPVDGKADVVRGAPPALAPAPAPAPAKAESPAEPAASPEQLKKQLDDVEKTLSAYERCAGASPDFAQRHGAAYDAWRASRATLVKQVESSPQRQASLEIDRKIAREKMENASAQDRAELAGYCENQLAPFLKGGAAASAK